VECLVVKGVSDVADKDKTDDWQPQAAMNAAEYLCEMMNKAGHLFGTLVVYMFVHCPGVDPRGGAQKVAGIQIPLARVHKLLFIMNSC